MREFFSHAFFLSLLLEPCGSCSLVGNRSVRTDSRAQIMQVPQVHVAQSLKAQKFPFFFLVWWTGLEWFMLEGRLNQGGVFDQ